MVIQSDLVIGFPLSSCSTTCKKHWYPLTNVLWYLPRRFQYPNPVKHKFVCFPFFLLAHLHCCFVYGYKVYCHQQVWGDHISLSVHLDLLSPFCSLKYIVSEPFLTQIPVPKKSEPNQINSASFIIVQWLKVWCLAVCIVVCMLRYKMFDCNCVWSYQVSGNWYLVTAFNLHLVCLLFMWWVKKKK